MPLLSRRPVPGPLARALFVALVLCSSAHAQGNVLLIVADDIGVDNIPAYGLGSDLPTTPFLLVAAYCFTRSSPGLHKWLHSHPTFGPLINNWNQYGSIDRRTKRIAIIVILLTPLMSVFIGVPWWALVSQILILAAAATFVLTRPGPPREL